MKKLPLLVIIIAVLFPLPAEEADDFDEAFVRMATKLSAAEAKLPRKTAAVYGFEVIGRPGDTYALYATEKLTHALVTDGKLLVIERSRIDEVLKEQKFSLTGTVDAGTAARIGKILSVDAVVTGTIRVTQEKTEFIVRIIQSETGIILASSNVEVWTDEEEAEGDDDAPAEVKLTLSKKSYTASEQITLIYSGLPGNENDWITLVKASDPDTAYGQWFYTKGEESGTHTFEKVSAGEYEIRVYFDWPAGGYEVHKRVKVTVK